MRHLIFLIIVLSGSVYGVSAQASEKAEARSSAAYAEVLVRKTEIAAEMEAVSADYTETNPKVLDMRNEIAALDKWLSRILSVKAAESGKLTSGLGKLIVRRCGLDADLARLVRAYNDEHQEVRRARKRLAVFDTAINDLMK